MIVFPESRDSYEATRLVVLEGWHETYIGRGALTELLNHATLDIRASTSELLRELAELRRTVGTHADVILFRESGKYYTEEQWAVPADAIGPYDMDRSPDFRRISDGGAVLVTDQRWGFPHLFPSEETPR